MQALRIHLSHMELKNWAFSLFNPERPLYHHGFVSVRPSPSISTPEGFLTPDLVAWNDSTILVIECCSGMPSADDSTKVDKYSQIPSTFYTALTGIDNPLLETVLLYYEEKFDSDAAARESVTRAISIRRSVIIWTCIPAITIHSVAGSHANTALESIMRGGAPLERYPSPQIEIQPDSPLELLARVLFRRLFERAIRSRDTSFTLTQARESIADQNYATRADEDVKLRRAVAIGSRLGLCGTEQPEVRWRLSFYVDSPLSIERFLSRLTGILSQPRLTDFGSSLI